MTTESGKVKSGKILYHVERMLRAIDFVTDNSPHSKLAETLAYWHARGAGTAALNKMRGH